MRFFALILASGAALAMVACGSGGDDDGPTATATTGSGSGSPAASATSGGGSATAQTTATTGATTGATTSATGTATGGSPTSAATSVATLPAAGTSPVTLPPVPTVTTQVGLLQDVRIAAHPETNSDRIVFEFSGALPEARVEYIAQATQCASGEVVDVTGSEVLSVRFLDAAQHDGSGNQTFESKEVSGTGSPITEAKQFCDFENELGWAVGVTGMQPFVVSQLSDPPRLVIDIAK